jgi:hypothetical protein
MVYSPWNEDHVSLVDGIYFITYQVLGFSLGEVVKLVAAVDVNT